MILIIAFITISCASASDNSNITANSGSDIPVNNMSAPGNFDNLQSDIENLNSGDIYNISQDYIFSPYNDPNYIGPKILIHEGIKITADNVTINGNGHVIDGNFNTAIFKVIGNNVKIINLTIINSKYNGLTISRMDSIEDMPKIGEAIIRPVISSTRTDMSAVYWLGDNGLIDNCIFKDNTAINGGAITWNGNNGVINNTLFINNTAQRIGGAIYMGGENNIISNCNFTNSVSLLTREAIYLDPGRKNIIARNLQSNELLVIDGQKTNIGANDLLRTNWIDISPFENDRQVDIIPLLYKAITLGGVNYMADNKTSYFCTYDKTTGDFALATHVNYGEIMDEYAGIDYIRQFSFRNISDFSQVLTNAYYTTYTTVTTQIGTIYINNADDYAKLLAKKNYPKFFSKKEDETRELNIIFTDKLSINSNSCLNLDATGCDIITLYGNDSSIMAKNDPRGEDKWVTNTKTIFIASNIQVGGFNTAIENKGGTVILNYVKLHDNKMDYYFDPDWGAGILNTGYCVCNNCSFINNYCSKGGAIFNYGRLELNNCTFKGNYAYQDGDNVLNVGEGIVIYNGNKIVHGDYGPIRYKESVDTALGSILICAAGLAAAVLILGGLIASVVTFNPIIAVICIGAAIAIVGTCIAIYTAYYTPRMDITNHNNQRLNPVDIVTPIYVIDEIVYN